MWSTGGWVGGWFGSNLGGVRRVREEREEIKDERVGLTYQVNN